MLRALGCALLLATPPALADAFVADGFLDGLSIGQCNGVAHSRDGKSIAAINNIEVVVWDGATSAVRARAKFTSSTGAQALAFSPDSRLLAVGTASAILLYASEDLALTGQLEIPAEGGVQALAFSPDSALLVASAGGERGKFSVYGDNVYDVATRKRLRTLAAAESSERLTSDFAFSPDGKWLALAISNKQKGVELYDTATWQRKARMAYVKDATKLAFTPDGTLLAVGSIDRSVRVHMIVEKAIALRKQWVAHVGTAKDDLGYVSGLAFVPGGSRLISASDDDLGLRSWDGATWEARGTVHHDVNRLGGFSLSPDGKSVLVGGVFAKRVQRFRVE